MERLKLSHDWLNEILPAGLPYPSSTLISGPGGSGKPLIGFAFVYDWLKAGGNVIFIPLQYPKTEIIKVTLKQLYNLNVEEYKGQITYIQFNPDLDTYKKINDDTIEANLLKPDVWDKAVDEAEDILNKKTDLGTLVFGSALNLLLFSPTYKSLSLNKFEKVIREDKTKTYMFSVSTSAFGEEIEKWEKLADNLMFAHMEKPMNLYLKIVKMENQENISKEIQIPMSKEMLESIKEEAENTRQRQIPKLSKI